MFGHQEVGVLLSQRAAYGCVYSGRPGDHKCVQFVFKNSLHHHVNIQSWHLMQQIISPAILGMFQTVAVPQLQLRYCAAGAVRAICELMGGTPAASCREVQTGPAVTCMLFIPKVNFSATFRHVRPSRSWRFAQPKIGLWVCVQWAPKRPQMRAVRVQKPPTSPYKHSELLFCAPNHISSDFGHVSNSSRSAVAAALLCSWRCTGRLRSRTGFQKQFLALWCLHLGSLLHTGVPQPAKSQMAPLTWCPIADSEQSSRVTDRRARCADLYISAQKNQFSCMYVGPRSQCGLEGVVNWTQMDPQLSPTLPRTWDSTWSPCTLCDCRRCRIC